MSPPFPLEVFCTGDFMLGNYFIPLLLVVLHPRPPYTIPLFSWYSYLVDSYHVPTHIYPIQFLQAGCVRESWLLGGKAGSGLLPELNTIWLCLPTARAAPLFLQLVLCYCPSLITPCAWETGRIRKRKVLYPSDFKC